MQPSAILVAARALIPTEAEWFGAVGRERRDDDRVMGRCLFYAIAKVTADAALRVRAANYIRAAGYVFSDRWNAPGRTLAEVHAASDLAADMALVNGE